MLLVKHLLSFWHNRRMPALLHILALGVSLVSLAFSVRQAWKSHWGQALIDALMVALMALVATSQSPLATFLSGMALIVLALIEALSIRLALYPSHVHRAICLLIMGAATIAMIGHTVTSAVSPHSHLIAFSLIGVIGIISVALLAITLRQRFSLSSVGMLVATALMSVATITG